MTGKKKKSWSDLSSAEKTMAVVTGLVQLALLTLAVRDLRRRPAAQVRGPKGLWYAVSLINFIGPITYFIAGRKPALAR
jgi:hypothetical protein